MKIAVFKIDSEEYGVDIECVKGIEDKVKITSVPNRPDYVLGIISLRGEVIPVFSIRRKFGKEEINEEITKLVVVSLNGNEENRVAFKVDEITRIVDIESTDIHQLPNICINNDIQYVKDVAKIEKDLVIILDVDNTLDEEELKELEKAVEENKSNI